MLIRLLNKIEQVGHTDTVIACFEVPSEGIDPPEVITWNGMAFKFHFNQNIGNHVEGTAALWRVYRPTTYLDLSGVKEGVKE